MNRSELIEAIAATLFRVWGFIFSVSTFVYFLRWEFYYAAALKRGTEVSAGTNLDGALALFHLLIAFLLFVKAVGLARLVCRGLEFQLTKREEESAT